MNKAELLAIVEASPSSIFARIDVINLISKLDESGPEPAKTEASKEEILDAIVNVKDALEAFENLDYTDADLELSLNGMEIEIERIEINGADEAIDQVQHALKVLRDCFPS